MLAGEMRESGKKRGFSGVANKLGFEIVFYVSFSILLVNLEVCTIPVLITAFWCYKARQT
jgi:hypothetical protein